MPHLSPMNWITMLMSSILIIMLLSASNWWSSSQSFKFKSPKFQHASKYMWKW